LLCLRNARAFPLLPAALASVPFGFVLVRVRSSIGSQKWEMGAEVASVGRPMETLRAVVGC